MIIFKNQNLLLKIRKKKKQQQQPLNTCLKCQEIYSCHYDYIADQVNELIQHDSLINKILYGLCVFIALVPSQIQRDC